ncbi:MAG: DUF1295 domain-containing protein [Spirochaetales bacterium]|nr:MAG: DUF1295 domain-containing protein [Spirochaetales bacterium]
MPALNAANPIVTLLILTASLVVCSFFFGLVSKDYSWVDRMWSTAPIFYAWVYAVRGWFDPRLFIAAVIVTIWGLRLTYNFARKGGYTGMEDYRWPVLRKKIKSPIAWQLFNFGFISLFQISLFLLFTLPLYRIFLEPGKAPAAGFYITAFFYLLFVVFETVADQQQWNFHKIKQAIAGGKPLPGGLTPRQTDYANDAKDGYCRSGLFRLSRHPNYFGELAVWWTFYVMGSLHARDFLHWSLIGPLLLTLVFFGSTRFTEAITLSKYPSYTDFQKSVSAVIPWFPLRRGAEKDAEIQPAE